MRFLSLLLLGLGILTLSLVVLASWLDCSPSEVVQHLRTLLNENQRQQDLEQQNRVVQKRLAERTQVMEEVVAGTLTLFEAAERFQRIGLSAESSLDPRAQEKPESEADWCRFVLRCLRVHLSRDPSRSARVLPPLLQAYRQRFGNLPADLERNLTSSDKPSSVRKPRPF